MNKEIDIKSLSACFKVHYKLALTIILTFFIAGLVYILSVDKIYTAETSIFIDPQQSNIIENVKSEQENLQQLSKSSIQSQVTILSSRKIILRVIEKLRQDKNTFLQERFVEKLNDKNIDMMVRYIKNNLIILHSDDTYIIDIRYQDTNPDVAAKIANFFATAYIEEQMQTNQDNSIKTRLWLSKKINNLKQKVSSTNKEVQDFKAQHNFSTSLQDTSNDTSPSSIVNQQLAKARGETALANARYEHSQNLIKTRNVDAALAEALDNDVINGIRGKYLDRKQKFYELQRTLGNTHHVVQKIKNEIQEYESSIFSEMERFTRIQLSAFEISTLQEKTLQAKLNELLTIEKNNSIEQTQLTELEQKAETYKNILDDFIEKYENLEQKEDFVLTSTRIISEAISPEMYSHPKTFLILSIMIALGGGIAFISVLYLASKDNTIKTAEEIADILGFKNLGYIPKQKSNPNYKGKNYKPEEPFVFDIPNSLISEENSSTLVNETFRKIKYRIDAIENPKNKCKSIGITSSKSNEGKTTVAINIAQYIANLGHKTLLIDLDTYNPMFNNNSFSYDVPTLKDYFQNNMPFDINKVLREAISGLYIIPGVLKKSKKHTSLDMQGIEAMFNYLSQNFEYIICDLPPLSVTADTEITIPYINGFITVVEWSKTEADILKNGLTNVGLHGGSHSKVIGTIINKIDLKKAKDLTNLYSNYVF
jgi:succinoglycan biosynthesis transport protein ExoP